MNYKRIMKAIDYMAFAHRNQVRKSNGLPQSVHMYSVAMILMTYGYEEDIIIAGLLHDVIEDTTHKIEEIKELFGDNVATLVMYETEIDKKNTWHDRKNHTIEFLKTAPLDAKVVAAADKMHNMLTLSDDLVTLGDSVWYSFNASKIDVLWYYSEVTNSICHGVDALIFTELKQVLNKTINICKEH